MSGRQVPRRAGFMQTIRAVLWSFVGIRKRRDYEADSAQLNPVAVIVAGIVAGVIFVLTLVLVVKFVLSQH
ncbi:DUF2970 domain-containing protein [Niveibacterium sp. SC-1]|uniref:DUF2970 domain-containing protein n=1 Tax=Niveibacterium sp. SC-1 TaxID=3135646 RepID=UPI00311D4177